MRKTIRWLLAAGGAAAMTAGVGALSQVPYEAESADHALLRLAWRVRGERVEDCRKLTPAELERLPAHMRHEEECTGRVLPYRLEVVLDGRAVVDERVHASGAREDRPIYVYRELTVPPGGHHLTVRFTRQDDGRQRTQPTESEEPEEPSELREGMAPRVLVLSAPVALEAEEIALVTYDPERQRLVLEGYGAP